MKAFFFDLNKKDRDACGDVEGEDIHRFRVEAKKLRAFLRLVIP